jgi:hypothetical protein
MIAHLTGFKLIAKEQNGFVNGKSCTTNLLEIIDIITEAINAGLVVDVIYLQAKGVRQR